ncbi:MAG: RlmE family RNA methyltransferase [Thermoplasmatota archaeon]
MARTRWYQDRVRDGYYKQAKKEGYRARSAYKLQQLQQRFRFLKKGYAVADLGCAPGGWSQVLTELVGPEGLVIGVDLQRVAPIEGARLMQGDFTKPATHRRLAKELADSGRGKLDAVVSDLAPDMTGNYDLDQSRSVHLCELAQGFAQAHLRPGGAFVLKVFEGADFQEFREGLRSAFRRVHHYHPPASRKASSEVYLVATGYKGRDDEAAAVDGSGEEE